MGGGHGWAAVGTRPGMGGGTRGWAVSRQGRDPKGQGAGVGPCPGVGDPSVALCPGGDTQGARYTAGMLRGPWGGRHRRGHPGDTGVGERRVPEGTGRGTPGTAPQPEQRGRGPPPGGVTGVGGGGGEDTNGARPGAPPPRSTGPGGGSGSAGGSGGRGRRGRGPSRAAAGRRCGEMCRCSKKARSGGGAGSGTGTGSRTGAGTYLPAA